MKITWEHPFCGWAPRLIRSNREVSKKPGKEGMIYNKVLLYLTSRASVSSISAGLGSSVLMGAVMPRLLVWTLLGVGCHEVIFAADGVKLNESASYSFPLDSFLLLLPLTFISSRTFVVSLLHNHFSNLKKSSATVLHRERCPEIAFLFLRNSLLHLPRSTDFQMETM